MVKISAKIWRDLGEGVNGEWVEGVVDSVLWLCRCIGVWIGIWKTNDECKTKNASPGRQAGRPSRPGRGEGEKRGREGRVYSASVLIARRGRVGLRGTSWDSTGLDRAALVPGPPTPTTDPPVRPPGAHRAPTGCGRARRWPWSGTWWPVLG